MSKNDLEIMWRAQPCNCGSEVCTAGSIEPFIVMYQGSMDLDTAIHIAKLHNDDLQRRQMEAKR